MGGEGGGVSLGKVGTVLGKPLTSGLGMYTFTTEYIHIFWT